jgi:hypothetical protein
VGHSTVNAMRGDRAVHGSDPLLASYLGLP